jgi:hypothetical protein
MEVWFGRLDAEEGLAADCILKYVESEICRLVV